MVKETDGEHEWGERGFTLIELMIVIGVMFILAGIALPRYQSSVKFARQAACAEDLYRLRQAIDQYHADQGVYPPTLSTLEEEGYIREIQPDPFTNEPFIGIMEEETDDPGATPGIWDVRSPSNCGGGEDESEDDW
jgi:general secretion pathway protein G